MQMLPLPQTLDTLSRESFRNHPPHKIPEETRGHRSRRTASRLQNHVDPIRLPRVDRFGDPRRRRKINYRPPRAGCTLNASCAASIFFQTNKSSTMMQPSLRNGKSSASDTNWGGGVKTCAFLSQDTQNCLFSDTAPVDMCGDATRDAFSANVVLRSPVTGSD